MEKMKYCTNCGKPIQEGAKFCGYCGAPVAGYKETGSTMADETGTRAQTNDTEQEQENSATVGEDDKEKGPNKYLIIGCVVAIIIICIIAFISLTSETKYDSPEALIEDMYDQCYIQEFNAEKVWDDFMSQKSKSFSFLTKDDFISELNEQKGQKKYINYTMTSCEETEDGVYTVVGDLKYQTDDSDDHSETKTDYVIAESGSYKLLYDGALSENSFHQTSESLDGITMGNMTIVDCLDQTLVYITIKNDTSFRALIGGNDVAEVTITDSDGTEYTYAFDDHFLIDPGESLTIEAKYDVRLGTHRIMTINDIGLVNSFGQIFNEGARSWNNEGFEEGDDAEENSESPAAFFSNAVETYLVNDYDLDKFWEECVSDRTKELAFITKEEFIEKFDIASYGGEYKGFDTSSAEEAEDGVFRITGTLRYQASPSGEQSDTYTFYVIKEDEEYKYLPFGTTDVTSYSEVYNYEHEGTSWMFDSVSLSLSNLKILWCEDDTKARMTLTNHLDDTYTIYDVTLTDLSGETYRYSSGEPYYEMQASESMDLWASFDKIGYAVEGIQINANLDMATDEIELSQGENK